MRLTWLLCVIFLVHVSAAVYSQTERVTLEANGVTVKESLRLLGKELKKDFFYSNVQFDAGRKVDLKLQEATLEEALGQVFPGQRVDFSLDGDFVVILGINAQSPEKNITEVYGVVKDENGDSLPGVTVLLKGTSTGFSTDAQGVFRGVLPVDFPMTLVFSSVGYKRQEHTIKSAEELPLAVRMVPDVKEMDEVVVTGYQVVNRRKNTSAVTSVKAEDIMRPGMTTIDQMLEGQIPDLISMTNSGEIGVAPKLRIRGTSTLIGNREPLWVIDGIVQQDPVNISPEELNNPDYINRIGNAISGLNPQDIDRIDVLKDASATALYGTKAANGVIVITTKRGHVGKPQVSYNMTGSFKFRPRYSDRHIDVMTSKERVQFSRDLLNNQYVFSANTSLVGYEYLYSQLYAKQLSYDEFVKQVSEMEALNTDWFAALGDDAFSTQHTISLTGGSDMIRYYASIGYTDDNDVIKSNRNDRYTAKLNLDIRFSEKVSLSLGFDGNKSTQKYYQNELAPINYAYNTSRTIPFRNADGTLHFYQKPGNGSTHYRFNILNELNNSGCTQDGSGLSFLANLLYNPLQWLRVSGIFSYSVSNTEIDSYWGAETHHVAAIRRGEFGGDIDAEESELPAGGELKQQTSRNENYTARLQLDVNKYFGADEQHNINASLGWEVSSTQYVGTDITNRGYYPDRGLQFATFEQGTYPKFDAWLLANRPTLTDNLTNLMAAYASVSYSYQNWITLNANARYDGSNRFGSQGNEKLLPVWSVSLSYNPLE
ncbi:MAG: SusC/RagA family TonB-linked outer membrane protein, partial [Odoribacter sp.]|nr:SusC/RagA family TonB-linked outer membrane protein [Odoribacter sp.]